MTRKFNRGLVVLVVGLMAGGAKSQDADVAACENELLDEAQVRAGYVTPSRGVADPTRRIDASDKARLKAAAADAIRQRPEPGVAPATGKDIEALQRRFLTQKQRLLRTHRGSEAELARALKALKQTVYGEVQP